MDNSYRCSCKPIVRFAVDCATHGVVYVGATVDASEAHD
jgi:hypothetical protein